MAREVHVSTQCLHHGIITGHVRVSQTHGRDAAPNELFLTLAKRFVIDPQFFVPCRHGVGAKHIDIKLFDQALKQCLALSSFEIDGDSLFAGIGCNEIAVPILPSHRTAYVPIGVAFGFSTWYWCGLQLDHTPAQVDEAKSRVCQGECLLDTDDGLRFRDDKFIT